MTRIFLLLVSCIIVPTDESRGKGIVESTIGSMNRCGGICALGPFFMDSVAQRWALVAGNVILFALFFCALRRRRWHSSSTVTRAAIDIGSGMTKVLVAEVDLENNNLVRVLISDDAEVCGGA